MVNRKRSSWFWILAVMAILAVAVAACGDDDDDDDGDGEDFPTVTIAAGETIKLGISSILTGDLESLGVPIADAA